MRNLNKRNVLTTNESSSRTLKKKVEKIIFKIWVKYVPSSVKVGSFLLHNPKVKHCETICSIKQIRSSLCLKCYQSVCIDLSFHHNAAINVVTH